MITIEKDLPLTIGYPLDRLGPAADLLFFDIETTGFSREYSHLYLIGCLYYRDQKWHLIQWFADTKESEAQLLDAFFKTLKSFRILVHFNGDTFDIPYLLARCARLGLPSSFLDITSVDLYKKIKKVKKLLKLQNLKQKTLEQFLMIQREDRYSGGELIEVYQEYLKNHNDYLYRLLILHNEEDLKGMIEILPILNYPDFFMKDFILVTEKLCLNNQTLDGRVAELYLTCQSNIQLPIPFSNFLDTWYLSARENILKIRILLYQGTCKYFYSNYKDYYYLTLEDTAIHKSVAQFVEKDFKKKATAKTCYTKKEACFIPQKQQILNPVFKQEYRDKLLFGEYQAGLFRDADILTQYIHHLTDFIK